MRPNPSSFYFSAMTAWVQLTLPMVVLLLSVSLASATTACVRVADYSAEPGGTVTVPVLVTNVTDLGGCDINITYNTSVIHVTDVSPGDMELLRYHIDNESGWVRMNAINTTGQSGNATFAHLNLTAVGDAGYVSLLCIADTILLNTSYESVPCIERNGKCRTFLNGDVDSNGVVDMHDSVYIMRHLLGVTGFTEIVAEAADVNGDGGVTSHDAMYLAKYLIGIGGYDELR